MSLQAILEAIRATGQAQVKEIEEKARDQVNEILAEARIEAEQVEKQACAAAVTPSARERARIIHQARLEALQITGDVRETLVEATLDQTRGRLAGIRTDPVYPKMLRQLAQEALTELEKSLEEAGKARLEADVRDRGLLEIILSDLRLKLPVSYELNCWGGLVAKSRDGRVVVINTLETRLDRATPYLRSYLAALFEKELPEVEVDRDVELATAL